MSAIKRYSNGNPITTPTPNPTPPPPTPLKITIIDDNLPNDTHDTYSITFDSTFTIQTLLTSTPSVVDTWLLETLRLHPPFPVLVGLDVEWRPNFKRGQSNPTAVLQLCINNRCLVFQIMHSPFIPTSLLNFLADANNKFVGVGIKEDVQKLMKDYNITVSNCVDLRNLAAEVMDDKEMLKTGIKSLVQKVIGKTLVKPKKISMSRWDYPWLNVDQVKYATVDAFVSFEIGCRLYSNQKN